MNEFNYKDLVMSNEEMAKTVEEQMEYLDSDAVEGMILHICETSEKEEPGKLKGASPMTKILYTAHEMYKRGFAEALYLCNKSLRTAFEKLA